MPAPTPVPARKMVLPGIPVTVPPRELPTVPEVAADVELEVEVRSDPKKVSSGCKIPFPMILVGGFIYIYIYGPVLRLSTPHGLGPQVPPTLSFYLQAIGSIFEVQLRIC